MSIVIKTSSPQRGTFFFSFKSSISVKDNTIPWYSQFGEQFSVYPCICTVILWVIYFVMSVLMCAFMLSFLWFNLGYQYGTTRVSRLRSSPEVSRTSVLHHLRIGPNNT